MNKNNVWRPATPPPQPAVSHTECGFCGRPAPVTRYGIACLCDPRVRAVLAARKETMT